MCRANVICLIGLSGLPTRQARDVGSVPGARQGGRGENGLDGLNVLSCTLVLMPPQNTAKVVTCDETNVLLRGYRPRAAVESHQTV